jgi:hypothetical protein
VLQFLVLSAEVIYESQLINDVFAVISDPEYPLSNLQYEGDQLSRNQQNKMSY